MRLVNIASDITKIHNLTSSSLLSLSILQENIYLVQKIKSFDKEIMSLTWRCNILSRIHYGEHMAANKFDEYAW